MNFIALQHDPAAFRQALLIDTDAGPRPLGECLDDWQKTDFEALDSGWQRAVVGTSHEARFQRAWLERPRGHSKSADLGIMAAWTLFSARRPLSGIAAAGDHDQARLLRDAIGKLLYINPWLAQILEVQNYRVLNTHTGSTLEIISSDAPSSYGLTPDFIVADELCHWKKRDLWDSLLSSAAKRACCMLVVITNAGLEDDWVWQTREAVRTDPNWYFSRLNGPVARWITPDRLAEQQRLLPSVAYRRLWLNEWTSGGGDALTKEDIEAAFGYGLGPMDGCVPGYEFVGGLDLGVTRDASAVVILGVRRSYEGHGTIRLAHVGVWRPDKGRKVNLQDIEDSLIKLHLKYQLKRLNYDSWQATHLAQRLTAAGLVTDTDRYPAVGLVSESQGSAVRHRPKVPMFEVPPTGGNLQSIASTLIEAFNDRRVRLYEHADLRRDLLRLRVEERSYGYRLTSPRDEHGHGDVGSAFGLAMLAASELASKRTIFAGAVPGMSVGGSTPFQRAVVDLDHQNRRLAAEEQRLAHCNDDYEGCYEIMREMGGGIRVPRRR